ncbi:DBH-like monooxygenase protein 1 homolog [Tubulanus polymorphus]|uniref:DBH-like monooxygenase protein 1 homolog n=1 Tax=Tubulanus polymorphus TaxID=672921 RepID=UPI003DA2E17F
MAISKAILVLVFSLGNAVLSAGLIDPPWRSEYLDMANKFKLEWRVKNAKVQFRVSVQTNGWFGLGISHDSRMPNSDVVVGWMNITSMFQTVGKLVDAHTGPSNSKPVADTDSNWFLTEAAYTNQRLNFSFHRLLKTNDSKQDIEIKHGMTHVIWAYSDNRPSSLQSISYHGTTRGHKSIEILPAYPRKVYLDNKKEYLLEWRYDEKEMKGGTITFRVTVKTTGYVGFGLSQSGAMKGSDIVIGWVTNGKAQLYDMHGIGNEIPLQDKKDNWNLIEGNEENGNTQLTFSRNLDTCDEGEDIKIESGAIKIIFSFNNEDPIDIGNARYHGSNRGVRTLYLLDEPAPTVKPGPDVKIYDLRPRKVALTSAKTTYYCSFVKMQLPVGQKFHALKLRHNVVKGNELIVHHVLVYRCPAGMYNDSLLNVHGECSSMIKHRLACRDVLAAFAIGSHETSFPENVGMPIGGAADSMYFMFETHYDNPEKRTDIVDDSSIEITYTSKLRQHEAGTIFMGSSSFNPIAIVVPPRQKKFLVRGVCLNSCLSKVLNKYTDQKEIHIFSKLGHAHLLGAGIRTRHFRDGYELPWILNDMTYDFNYQTWRPLKKYLTIKSAGQGTEEEMCYSVFMYYPKIPMATCESIADTTTPAMQNINWAMKMGHASFHS